MKKILLILLLLPLITFSQVICGADEYNRKLIENNGEKYKLINSQIKNYVKNNNITKRGDSTTFVQIAVVFHVVWHDSIQNIPDSVIYQQLDALNRDFNLEDTDTSTLTDTLKQLPGKMMFEFCLATKDPDGNNHKGITRTHTNALAFWLNNTIKREGIINGGKKPWDPKKYLNIWVGNLSNGLLGYAQFPGGPDSTDGVVVHYKIVGDGNYPWSWGPPYTKGRVLAHEIGHWINLRHPWGNSGGCGENMIYDIEKQKSPYWSCPDTAFSICHGDTTRDIVKHFMDYSGDTCMVMFTKGQVDYGRAGLLIGHPTHYSIDPWGCGGSGELLPNPYLPSKVKEEKLKEIKIYPTLTNTSIIVENNLSLNGLYLKIYSVSGKLIKTQDISLTNEIKIDVSNLTQGLYFINLIHENERISTRKLIIGPSHLMIKEDIKE